MQIGSNNESLTWFLRLATVTLVIAVLHFGEDVLLPIAFAGLLAFLLSPLVVRLGRWGLPKTASIIATVTFAFAVIGAVGWVVTSQAIGLMRELPKYEENLHRKITALKQPHAPPFVSRAADMVDNLQRDLNTPDPQRPSPPSTEPKPLPVEVKATQVSPWQVVREYATPVLRPFGIAGIVIVFVVAMLFQREDLRDRVIKLLSAGQLNVATQALDDAASRVSRYLGMQLVVNATYGIPVGIGLFFIGIPNASLWGLLATLLRFIPFLGPWIAAAFPVSLAIVVDPGWMKLVYVLALFITMELISNNIVEVVLYGATTGISNLALLVAAVFWTWLWGPAGLVLSTPLTVCLLVLGKYVPGLNFLRMLLGSDPVLEPPAQFYQRMLSMESEDMLDLATKYIAEHSLAEFYDDVFLPALLLSEEDRHRGTLPELRQQFIFQASRELIDELERQDQNATKKEAGGDPDAVEAAVHPTSPEVLGVVARDEADEIVALMLCHLLRRRGIIAAVQTRTAPFQDTINAIRGHHVRAVFISALPPSTVGAARHACRLLRESFSRLPIVLGVWRYPTSLNELHDRLRVVRPEEIAGTLAEAEAGICRHVPGCTAPLPKPAPIPEPAITPLANAKEA